MPNIGAETTVYESRPYMDRNNVLKLWSFVMEDLKSLGAKKFCPNLGKQEIPAITFKNTKKKRIKMTKRKSWRMRTTKRKSGG